MRPQPRAVIEALLPDRWRGDGLVLRPLTAGDILFLEKLNCAVFADQDECPAADAYLAAYLLSQPAGAVQAEWDNGENVWVRAVILMQSRYKMDAKQIRNVLRGLLAEAFDSCMETRWPSPEGVSFGAEVADKNGNGLGWLLTVLDVLCFNYGWPMETVLRLPLSTVFALLTARKINSGAEFAEPNYYEREQFDDIAAKVLGVHADAGQ